MDNQTAWGEQHNAGVSILTAAPLSEAEGDGANVGAVLVVAFLAAITVVALGRVLSPAAQLAQTLVGATGAVILTVLAALLVVLLVAG